MKSKVKNKDEQLRKTFRVSFHKTEHKDVIDIIEGRSKTLRCELIAEAIRYFWENRLDVMTKNEKGNEENARIVGPGKATANIGELFKC